MESLRQVGAGILLGIFSIVIILGGFSLAMAEGGLVSQAPAAASPTANASNSIVVTIFPTLPLPVTETPQITPQETVSVVDFTATVSPTSLVSLTPLPTLKLCPPPAGWLAIVVRSSDTLAGLAQVYHTTVDELRTKNCLLSDQLVSGSILHVPPLPTSTLIACSSPANWGYYTVLPGDTLYHISLLYRISVQQLMQANCLYTTTISAGRRLRVPNVPTSTPAATDTSFPTFTDSPSSTFTSTASSTPTLQPFISSTPVPTIPTATMTITATALPTNTSTPATPLAAQ